MPDVVAEAKVISFVAIKSSVLQYIVSALISFLPKHLHQLCLPDVHNGSQGVRNGVCKSERAMEMLAMSTAFRGFQGIVIKIDRYLDIDIEKGSG